MNDDEKLLPCPHCGGEATTNELQKIRNEHMPPGWGWVGCQNCRCFINWSHGDRGKGLAIAAWNRRI